jgi:restriction system protein
VDITATKGGVNYAFQCKRYVSPVGVKAVQEVFAGSRKYGADRAVVVTNSTYTPNAKTLANDLGVTLWDLEMLDAIM